MDKILDFKKEPYIAFFFLFLAATVFSLPFIHYFFKGLGIEIDKLPYQFMKIWVWLLLFCWVVAGIFTTIYLLNNQNRAKKELSNLPKLERKGITIIFGIFFILFGVLFRFLNLNNTLWISYIVLGVSVLSGMNIFVKRK